MRTFSLVEGTSDKFWNIDVVGSSVTVHYGRTGTNGQTKTTQYDTAEKAASESAKLIASKVKKGYVEGSGGGSITPAPAAVKGAPAVKAPAPASPAPAAQPPARAPEPEPEARWAGGEELTVVTTALERAMLAGEPLPATPMEGTFAKADARAWVAEHAHLKDSWWNDLTFDTEPFDGVPSPEAATWWLRFGQGRVTHSSDHRFGEVPPVRTRLAWADKVADGPGDLDGPARRYNLPPQVLVASYLALAGPEETLAALGRADYLRDERDELLPALRTLVVPLLEPHQRVMPPMPPQLPSPNPAPDGLREAIHALARACLFGTADEVRAAVEAVWAIDGKEGPGLPLTMAAASVITDPDERWAMLERQGRDRRVPGLRPWLVLAGARGVPAVLEGLRSEHTDKFDVIATIEVLGATLAGPGLVPLMLGLADDIRGTQAAAAWLAAHPKAVAASTAEPTASQRDLLRTVVREVRAADPAAYGTDVASPALARILAELAEEDAMPTVGADEAPAWFAEAAAAEAEAPVEPGTLKLGSPSWALDALPPLVVDGVRLDADLTSDVLVSAVKGANDETRTPRPLVAAVRDHMRARDRDALAIPLLQAFLAGGGKPADRAWFVAAGYLGADGFVQTLTPLVRAWPGQSQHQRAVLGLDVLAATGTTSALQSISGIANKSKFKGVQKAAQEALAKIAAIQGLTVDQLEDRVVPDADLDARGVRVFSYGPRSFRVSLSPQGKAVIRDLDADGRPTGKPRTTLPAPNSKDDPELAAAAKADFAVLRKQLTDVAKVQTARLEKAMVTGRTWAADEHRTLVAEHPVLNSLIRPLVWHVLVDGAPVATVRVTEEQEYVTVDEDAYDVPQGATVALAHPLQLSDAERDAWRAHLVDYDLVAPLEQLDRATFGLPAGQRGPRLAELPAGTINPGALVSTLERLGWRRGNPADAGVVSYLYLPFEEHGLAAVLGIAEGLWTGMIHESGDQRLEVAYLSRLENARRLWYVDDRDSEWLDWGTAGPVMVSEVRRSLAALAEKMS